MTIGNIYYLIPNLPKPPLNIRSNIFKDPKAIVKSIWKRLNTDSKAIIGGIKIHYLHCTLLNELGYSAFPLVMGGRELHDFDYSGKVLDLNQFGTKLNDNDIVIGTEFCPYEALNFQGGIKAVFVQNWINLLPARRFKPEDDGKSYYAMGYDHIMCCSEYIREYVKENMGADSILVKNGIDISRFKPDPTKRMEHRVLYMPRKNHQDIAKIRKLLPEGLFDFVPAHGLSESQLIFEFQKSDIFLASGYPEGFGLPPLEAMACGCAVAGFTGKGASEFMVDGITAMVAEDGDCFTVAQKMLRLAKDKTLKEKIRLGGLNISKNYSLELVKSDLRKFFENLDEKSSKNDCIENKNESRKLKIL